MFIRRYVVKNDAERDRPTIRGGGFDSLATEVILISHYIIFIADLHNQKFFLLLKNRKASQIYILNLWLRISKEI